MTEHTLRQQVQLESPFGAPSRDGIITNVAYALLAMHDSLYRGEAPFASHLLYTQMFDDNKPNEREIGIQAGLVIADNASATVVYGDLGISRGMQFGIDYARKIGRPIYHRRLYEASQSLTEIEQRIRNNSPLPLDAIAAVYARIHN